MLISGSLERISCSALPTAAFTAFIVSGEFGVIDFFAAVPAAAIVGVVLDDANLSLCDDDRRPTFDFFPLLPRTPAE